MPIFNRTTKKEDQIVTISDFEKQILRINTIEVQLKKLLEFERQIRTSMFEEEKGKKNGNQIQALKADKTRTVSTKEFSHYLNMLEAANRRLERIEKTIKVDSDTNHKEISDKEIWKVINQYFLEKQKENQNKERIMEERIKSLEYLVLNLVSEEQKNQSRSNIDKLINGERRNDTPVKTEPNKQSLQKMDDRIFSSKVIKRVNNLEKNYQILNGLQEELSAKINEISLENNLLTNMINDSCVDKEEKEIQNFYIDKIYIDKYELANNIDQVGIKELSGALNIGATYGKEVVPKEVTEELKKQFNGIKSNDENETKNEKENNEEHVDHQGSESSDSMDEDIFTVLNIDDTDI